MEIFAQIAIRIIKEQELIIGPLAWDEARKVAGLNIVNQSTGEVAFNGEKTDILNRLVAQYEHLFGRASREVCHDAAAPFLADMLPAEVPASLR
ncbi:MAG: hypothetical protein A3B23_00390 [Candidatus Colwellbacteria bacterium RIFCSPLOWO2_01_FULL_48_10]|uniref:Uncharacterized protein n=2 Tax=Bacteria candidate phyla TaxID=1783234 RepID=A0A1F5P349_9BACT|nr:MAG: hypothetical protein A2846_04685 [Candidatus Doudnabacteria bacterium RIFCSPHIGHO2_01_FULL_49_9]OGY59167.1 MAG: hypothetical protein A3B23_00390 [Candidatus Colwellbacteria bacterium RIFCSPLOWO2_01_FULL_48_10]